MQLQTPIECSAPHVLHPAVAFAEGYQLKATGWTAGLPAWRDDVLFCMKGDQFQEHTWNDHL